VCANVGNNFTGFNDYIYIYTLFNFNNLKYEIDLLKEGGPPLWSNAH